MPVMPLDLPPDLYRFRSRAFRFIADHLETNDVLSSLGINWASWKGEDPDWDVTLPTDGMCPWIRVTPYPETQEPASYDYDTAPLLILIEAAIEGTRVENLMDLWECIEVALRQDALTADGSQLSQKLQNEYRVERHQVTQPAIGFIRSAPPASSGLLYAKGVVSLYLHLLR